MALVQQQGHKEELGQHVGVQDPPEENDHQAGQTGQLMDVDMEIKLVCCPVPTYSRDDALDSKEQDREAHRCKES